MSYKPTVGPALRGEAYAGRIRTPLRGDDDMGRRIAFGALGTTVGYAIGAFGGGSLVSLLSSNTHDRAVESAMTGAFVLGPLGAVVGCLVGFRRGTRTGSRPQ